MIRSSGTKIGTVAFSVYDLTVCILDDDLMARHKFIFWHDYSPCLRISQSAHDTQT
jgi:hypothetical protein